MPTEIYKSSNNKNCTNRNLQIFQQISTNLPTIKSSHRYLQIFQQISTNLPTNIYKSSNNKRYQQKPTSTALYWPRTTKYQLGTAYTDPVPPSTDQYRPILTKYHQVPNSIALYWPRTIKYQLGTAYTDPVPLSTNQCHPLLTKHHQVPTSTALYWVSITDPVTPSTNSYWPMLTHVLKQFLVIWSDLGKFWGSLRSALDWCGGWLV